VVHRRGAKQIYVRTPRGKQPAAGQSKPSGAPTGFQLDGDSYLTLRGINLFATSLTTDNLAPTATLARRASRRQQHPHRRDEGALRLALHDLTGNYQMQWQQKSG
jgi:hypothetical protein